MEKEEIKNNEIDHTTDEDNNYYGEEEQHQEAPKTVKSSEEKEVKKDDPQPKENKEESTDEKKPQETKKDDVNLEDLQERILKTKKWGQENNRKLVSQKRKITDLLTSLNSEGILPEENVQEFLSTLEAADEEDTQEEEKVVSNPYNGLKEKLDSEFKVFKRYNKGTELDAKYKAFYDFFPMLDEKQQSKAMDYIKDAEPDEALDYVMTNGEDLYNTLYKGAKEKGSIVKYVQHLQNKLKKLEKTASDLAEEVDATTKKVYNKPDSIAKENTDNSFFDNDYYS